MPNVKTIRRGSFRGCSSLTNISLPNANMIGDGAFRECSSLTGISLPNANIIGKDVFCFCGDSLKVLKLGVNTEITTHREAFEAFFMHSNKIDLYLGTYEYENADSLNKKWKGLTWKSINPYWITY